MTSDHRSDADVTASARARRALEIFEAAAALDDAARATFLAGAIGVDADLRAAVDALFAADAALITDAGQGESRAPITPPARVSVYRLSELIGAGGMGAVYRAERDDGLYAQTVAIKFLRPRAGTDRRALQSESQLLARLGHPGIARILDAGATDAGLAYIVMEFVEGVPLDAPAALAGADLARRVDIVHAMAGAVAHAHQNLVAHGDIKPGNVLLRPDGRPVLVDFGVARLTLPTTAPVPTGLTRGFASPERLAGAPPSVADDIFALGATAQAIGLGDPDRLRADRRADLAAILARATAPLAADRYPTVAAFADDLDRWRQSRPVTARAAGPGHALRLFIDRRPMTFLSVVGAVAALTAAFVTINALYAIAERERALAATRFADVRDLARFVLFDLNDLLATAPGATPAREAMAARSQRYLEALAASAGNDFSLRLDVARGLARLGEVRGVPGRQNLGDRTGAEANLRSALKLLARLDAERPDDPAVRGERGHVRYLLALLEPDFTKMAADAAEAGADMQARLAAPEGLDIATRARFETLLQGARLTQAYALSFNGDYESARVIQAAEEARMLALPAAVKAAMDFDYESGRAPVKLGDSLYYLERYEEAAAAYERAAARFAAGLKVRPNDRKLLEGAALADYSIGSTLADLDRAADGLPALDRAVAYAERVVALDPDDQSAAELLSIVVLQRAITHAAIGRVADAVTDIETEVARRDAAATAQPDNAELARAAAVPLRSLGDILLGAGDVPAACAAYRRAAAAWDGLAARGLLAPLWETQDVEPIKAALAANCTP